MATATDAYAESVTGSTEDYLDSVRTCTALLPATLLRYGEPEFHESVMRLGDYESTCDAQLRELRSLLGDAEPNYTDVFLRTPDVMELYALLDEVPNAAEQFVRDLDAVRPALSDPTHEDFVNAAALSSRATWLVCDVVGRYVSSLVSPGGSVDVTDTAERVSALERRADDRTYAAIERSFDRLETADALVVRDLAQSLDATLDAAEDAADHLLFMASATY